MGSEMCIRDRTMPLPPTATSVSGDGAPTDDDERPSVKGDTGHVANGLGDGRVPAPTRGPPSAAAAAAAKKRQRVASDVQRNGRNNQSALRLPGQRGSGSTTYQQPQQQRVGKTTASVGASDRSTQMLNGAHSKASVPPNGRQRPSSDKSVKLLVNYRSTNDRHAPLQSAYGNRDFFGPSSNQASNDAAANAASGGCALETPFSGKKDVKPAVHCNQSRLDCLSLNHT